MNADDTFRHVLWACLLVLLCIGLFHRIKARTGEPLDRRQEGLFTLIALRILALANLICVGAYLFKASSVDLGAVPLPLWLRWLGVGLWCLTCLLLFWTLRSLGKNLTDTVVTRKQATLVSHGPYQWVRHPFYVCAALMVVALSLIAANAIFLIIGSAMVGLLALRTRVEEANLLARFGADYQNYMDRTGRFFPRL
jgi:protein-S-isoprenylcysteine O-methyltransferase Ste14